MGETPVKVRLLTSDYQIEGTMLVASGQSLEDALAAEREYMEIRDARCFDASLHQGFFDTKSLTVRVAAIQSIGRIDDITRDSLGAAASRGLPAEFASTCAGDLMKPRVVTARPSDDVSEAYRQMTTHRIRHLPVIDNGQLVGLVTDRDLRIFLLSGKHMNLEEMMIQRVRLAVIGPKDSLKQACELMVQRKISCLPVVLDNQLAGIVTETDVLKFLMKFL